MLFDDVVIIKQAEKEDEATVITINCPDKTGLGCDLCRTILFFGLSIVRGGMFVIILLLLLRLPFNNFFIWSSVQSEKQSFIKSRLLFVINDL